MSAYGFVPIVHLVTLVFCIIELGLTGYVVSVFDTPYNDYSPSDVNFMLFCSIWSLLVLLYVGLTPLYYDRIFHRLVSVTLLGITTVFWFAGSIAWAVDVGGPWNCSGSNFCGSVEASVAFGFFIWALFTFLFVLDAIEAMRSRGSTTTSAAHPKPYVGA